MILDFDSLINDLLNSTPIDYRNYIIKDEPKHGHWIYEGKRGRFPACKCSVCGNVENADWTTLNDKVNYCPNCGSRMDEKENI